jgi:hypothetical protein
MKRLALSIVVILIAISASGLAFAEEVGWSEAVTRLTAEGTKATECVRQLKKRGDAAAQDAGRKKYEAARSAMDTVITGLIASLDDDSGDVEASKIEKEITGVVEGRLSFCAIVDPMIPKSDGDRNIFADIMRDTLKPTLAAAAGLLGIENSQNNLLRRKTIQTQLEGARWPDFERIPAAS